MGADPRCVVEYVATYSTGTFGVLNVVADPGVAADPRFLTVCDPTNLYGGTGGDANGDQKMARVDILVVPPFGQLPNGRVVELRAQGPLDVVDC